MITFPTTTEAFCEFQEVSTGRTLEAWEKEFSVELVNIANSAFDDGKAGLERFNILEHVEVFFLNEGRTDLLQEKGVQHIIKMMDAWSRIAYNAGKEVSRHG